MRKICDDGEEIAGIALDDFENGIEVDTDDPAPGWTCIKFLCYTIRSVHLKDVFKDFVKLFPDVVFICAGTYDCSLSHMTFGNTWFAAFGGRIKGCDNDEITPHDVGYRDEDDDDYDEEDHTDYEELIWDEELPKMFTANFSAWLEGIAFVERLKETGQDERFLAGLREIVG